MAEDSRLVELMAEMLIKQDAMVDELKGVRSEVSSVKSEVTKVNSEIAKLNLLSAENTRAIMKLADKIDQLVQLEGRVKKLEAAVFK